MARVLVWAARPNRRSPVCLGGGGERLVGRGFRRAAENGTPAACAPRGVRLLTSAATGALTFFGPITARAGRKLESPYVVSYKGGGVRLLTSAATGGAR